MTFAVIRRAGLVSFSAVIAFLTPITTPTAALADIGIAARYPGDKNIASDPAVIFADDFESYTSPSDLKTRWTDAFGRIRLATEAGNFYGGAKSLEFTLPISTVEVADGVRKHLATPQM